MKASILALVSSSFVLFGAVGCTITPVADEKSSSESNESKSGKKATSPKDDEATPVEDRRSSEPSATLSYVGPFVVGDGTSEKGDAACFSALGVKRAPSTGAQVFKVELQGSVTELQVKASKLCGGESSTTSGGGVVLMKDGAIVAKREFQFGDSPDIVRDGVVRFGGEDDEPLVPGEYQVVLGSTEFSFDADALGRFNDFAVGSIEVGVIGMGKLVKLGDPKADARSEVAWSEAFSLGDNTFENVAGDDACRSALGTGAATAGEKRFTIEISEGVTDLALQVDKTCGGESGTVYRGELRVYEGDNVLLAKSRIVYREPENVVSHVIHINPQSAGRKLAAGKYTVEIAADKMPSYITNYGAYNDIAFSGLTAWVVGDGATIKKL